LAREGNGHGSGAIPAIKGSNTRNTDLTDDIQQRPRPPRPSRLLRLLAVAGVVVLVLLALAWFNRRTLAREALTGWLEQRGIPARAQVAVISPTTFTARLSVGDPRAPDFAADKVDVRYRLRLTGLEIVSVTLRKPVLRARLKPDGLHVGALDPLVQDFLRRPPQPDAAKPRIVVEDGVLLLNTDYGPVRLTADARVEDGQLQTLAATSAPARLSGRGFDVSLGAGALGVSRRAGAVALNLAAPVTAVTTGDARLDAAQLKLIASLPYPDVGERRAEGPVTANLTLTGAKASLGGQSLEDVELSAGFTGRASGWLDALQMRGQASASLRAGRGRFGAGSARTLRAALISDDLAWTHDRGGERLSGGLKLNGAVQDLDAGDLTLTEAAFTAAGPFRVAPSRIEGNVVGSLVGRGVYRGLGAPADDDDGTLLAVKRAARGFRIAAPRVELGGALGTPGARDASAAPAWRVRLAEPIVVRSDSGAQLRVADGLHVTASGGGLPTTDLRITYLSLGAKPAAEIALTTSGLSVGPARNLRLNAAGRVAMAGGGVTFDASRCVAVAAERLEFDANDVTALSGRLCPAGGPVFATTGASWQVNGRAEGVAATIPFAQARVTGGAARVSTRGAGADMRSTMQVTAARVEDTAAETRFHPLALTGDVTLRDFIWRADMAVWRPSDQAPLGTARITHDGRLGFGVAVIETATLAFDPNSLQPAQLSPLASALGPPVTGQAQFSGRFDWSPQGATSSGKVIIPGLDFTSPAGPVKGLKGQIVFESLAPLKAAPGQELTVDAVQGPILLTGLRARFEVVDQLLKVEGGEAAVGGGRVRVETLEIPLVPGAPTRGVLYVEGVQLHDLVEASPFGDKVELDAKVSGRVPFEITGSRLRISGGALKADQPGRLSIDRAALTSVQAGPQGEAPAPSPNDTFTDFAYQAMENLAFDTLELTLASREDGRLGLLFRIVGRHDPPQKQQIRLSILDLIQQKFLGRKLPLPSGTGVNLTLDTTLNLDDLLGDWAEYQRVRSGSAPVQP
jgi:hypothetical protein